MEQHSKVSACDLENLTDLLGVQLLDFAAHKRHALVGRHRIETLLDFPSDFGCVHLGIDRARRPGLAAGRGELLLEYFVDVLHLMVPL